MVEVHEQEPSLEIFARQEFEELAVQLAEAYDFPELEKAKLIFTRGGESAASKLNKDIVPFYAKQFDSRTLGFEFDLNRHAKFRAAFKDMYSDTLVEERGLDRLATMFYLGCGMVRPITEYEFFIKHAPMKPQQRRAALQIYEGRKDLESMFEDVFGLDASGPMNAQLVNEVPDAEIIPINTTRIATSFLYGGLQDDATKVAFGDILHTSRAILYDAVVHGRPDYQRISTAGHMDDAARKGDWLLLNTIPSWLLAFATPIKPESYGHLSAKFWQDRFAVIDSHSMSFVLEETGIEKDTQDLSDPTPQGMPIPIFPESHYSNSRFRSDK